MATELNRLRTREIGETLVTAELENQGLRCKFVREGRSTRLRVECNEDRITDVQVKTIQSHGNWQFNISEFLDIEICEEEHQQKVLGTKPPIDIVCILVLLPSPSVPDEKSTFYILRWTDIQDHFKRTYRRGGPRCKNLHSMHCAIIRTEPWLDQHKDNWNLISETI